MSHRKGQGRPFGRDNFNFKILTSKHNFNFKTREVFQAEKRPTFFILKHLTSFTLIGAHQWHVAEWNQGCLPHNHRHWGSWCASVVRC